MKEFITDNNDRQPQHATEWGQSKIDPDLTDLNFRSIDQTDGFHFLKPHLQSSDRRNDGRLRDGLLKIFNCLEAGGWICTGIDPLTMKASEWGCLKPDRPRWDENKRKFIKYEHPHGIPTELFCLRLTYQIGLKIAKNNGLEAETRYLDRMGDSSLTDEDCGFWQWVIDNPSLRIAITEGVKKCASLLSAGHLAIALPGIFNGYRSKINRVPCIPFLIPQLEIFMANGREIVFCFDSDTNPKTIANVNTAIDKTGKLLERRGCKVSVTTWNYPYKGVDDLIYHMGEETYQQTLNNRQNLDKWRLGTTFSISDLPQNTADTRYLAPTVRPDNLAGKIIALKSAKGTGKTEYLAKILEPELDRGRSVLVITHRIQLAKALAQRLGINHLSEVRQNETGSLLGYSLCVDSLHPKSQARFNPEVWDNAIVVLDECEQVLWHMLNSQTCQGHRVAILQTFETLLRNVAHSNGTIILSDADLSKVSIKYVQKLTDNCLGLWLLTNSFNPNQDNRKLFIYNSPEQILSAAYTALEKGEKIILHCSSQKSKSMWSTQNIESSLAKKFPNLEILRVDAETVADPTHPAYGCIEHINEIVTKYDITIASPTIETGISIDANHFDGVWALVNGVQTVDAVCQTIERVRSDIPRHICITTGGISRVGNGSDSIRHLLHSEHKLFKANSQSLSIVDAIASADDRTPAHMNAWGCYAARVNQGFKNYEQNILDKLESEGYKIVPFAPDPEIFIPTDEISLAIKNARSENYQAEREGKINEPNPDDLELATLKKKIAKTKQERHREAKGILCRRYLTEDITPDLIIKDDDGWHPQLQLHYYLTIGREHLKSRDTSKVGGLSPDGHHPFKPDVNRSVLSTKVGVLRGLNIEQFFREDRTFTADSLSDWHSTVMRYQSVIKEVLGIWISHKSTPIQAAQQLLGKLGLKLKYIDRIRIDGELTRRYSGVSCNADERQDVLERWLARDNRLARMAECSTPSIDSINGEGGTVSSLEVITA
jgi:hypothetical protein